MKRLILYFIFLIVAVWVGLKIHDSPGYVFIAYRHWSVETTLWFAVIAILILWLCIYIAYSILQTFFALGGRLKNWRRYRYQAKTLQWMNQGFCQLAEGKWSLAEKQLIKSAATSQAPLINYLAAARAAQAQGALVRRDAYLQAAQQFSPGKEIAIGLTQAKLQLDSQQYTQALATLKYLKQMAPQHAYVLKLLSQTYVQLKDWQALASILTQLKKSKVLPNDQFVSLQHQTYENLLLAVSHADLAQLNEAWQKLPKDLQHDAHLVSLYANALIVLKQNDAAETILRQTLKRNWHDALLALYGQAIGQNSAKQLALAESWLRSQPENPALFLCLGRICAHNQLWGRAKDCLEKAAKLKPSAEIFYELGQVLEQLGDAQAALRYYHSGLHLVITSALFRKI